MFCPFCDKDVRNVYRHIYSRHLDALGVEDVDARKALKEMGGDDCIRVWTCFCGARRYFISRSMFARDMKDHCDAYGGLLAHFVLGEASRQIRADWDSLIP